jgi:dipeptidyl aminopeptidase/acylaminoacyl peptidase
LFKLAVTGGTPRPITPTFGNAASPAVSADGKWVVFVHTYNRVDGLALVDSDGELWSRKLAFGTDFVMQPVWHPQGTSIAFITWNHPNMPWDGTKLKLAALKYDHTGAPYIESTEVIVGNDNTAIFQPEFSPDGRYLSYISDATGFGHIYLYDLNTKSHKMVTETPAEHGKPAWVQGMRVYGWTADSKNLYFLRNTAGFNTLHHYAIDGGEETPVAGLDHYTDLEQIAVNANGRLAMIASSSHISPRVISFSPQSGERIHSRSGMEHIQPEALSMPQPIEWTGHDGGKAYGLYYPPASAKYEGIGKPPLIVMVHGGPTSQKTASYDSETQFFATRGFAVLQVNHRGGTGYGREYMKKLRGNWGIYDVEDSVSGAQYLIDQSLVDPERIVICGGSAGGFTVLQSLVDKPGFYKAGVCKYGISNQFILAQDTHKFEERYNDSLLGTLPDAADIYRQRSPLFHAEKIVDPVILFQGADDPVVQKPQSDSIVEALKAQGTPYEYHVFEGEGHGFRKPENIEAYYDLTLKFLTQYVLYA